jgi:hypothetical protein
MRSVTAHKGPCVRPQRCFGGNSMAAPRRGLAVASVLVTSGIAVQPASQSRSEQVACWLQFVGSRRFAIAANRQLRGDFCRFSPDELSVTSSNCSHLTWSAVGPGPEYPWNAIFMPWVGGHDETDLRIAMCLSTCPRSAHGTPQHVIRQAIAVARLIGVPAAVHVRQVERPNGPQRAARREEFADGG